MFDVSFWELVLVFVIGLLVLGPERLPKVATQIGRWVGRARRTASQLRHQLEREIALNEITKSQKRRESEQPKQPAPSAGSPHSAAQAESPPAPEPQAPAEGARERQDPPAPG